jgi:hypothetical protein
MEKEVNQVEPEPPPFLKIHPDDNLLVGAA